MALLRCETSKGPREGFTGVGVPSADGFKEHLTIEDKFLVHRHGSTYLAVAVVGRDLKRNRALVQLPYEADSGANRVWVRSDQVEYEEDEVPA